MTNAAEIRRSRQACGRSASTIGATARPRSRVQPGYDLKAVQEMLRHSSLSITAETYTTIFSAMADAMVDVVPRKVAVGKAVETDIPTTFPQGRPAVLLPKPEG
jgi:hypothetical protein